MNDTTLTNTVAEPIIDLSDEDVQRAQIIHVLTIYPTISPTMLQMGLGPGTKPAVWRPALGALVSEGIVIEETINKMSPKGQFRRYSMLSLAPDVLKVEQQKMAEG